MLGRSSGMHGAEILGQGIGGGAKTAEGRAAQRAGVTSADFRRKRRDIMLAKWVEPHFRAAALATLEESRRTWNTPKQRDASSRNMAKLRRDPAFNEKMFRAMRMSPNKVEKALWERIGSEGWLFTGDGKLVTRSGLVPDFRYLGPSGDRRLVVEVFGDYWHAGQDPAERVARLRVDGYETLVLWEREVREDLEGCVRRVRELVDA